MPIAASHIIFIYMCVCVTVNNRILPITEFLPTTCREKNGIPIIVVINKLSRLLI